MPRSRTLPHNDNAEQSVLGAVLIDKDAINIVSEVLKPESFYNETHAVIYDCMLTLYEQRKPIDLLTISATLKKKDIEEVDSEYFTKLIEAVPSAANVEHYATLEHEAYTKRSLIRSSGEVT